MSNRLHIVPTNDTKQHNTDNPNCWCQPVIEPNLVVHNAADGREFFEEDEREALKAGLADMAAGRLVPIEEVRRKLDYGKAV